MITQTFKSQDTGVTLTIYYNGLVTVGQAELPIHVHDIHKLLAIWEAWARGDTSAQDIGSEIS